MSQSLPQQKKSQLISNHRNDTLCIFYSSNSYYKKSNGSEISMHSRQQSSSTDYRRMIHDSDVDDWIKESRIDLERSGLEIPVEPVTLLFFNLCFRYCTETTEETSVFESIKGYAKPGTMLALLSSSKESRNTLLKFLLERAPPGGSLIGELQANGLKPGTTFSRLVGYVENVDAHQPYLSVKESLQFSASLRLDRSISSISRRVHVESVLEQLGLILYAN